MKKLSIYILVAVVSFLCGVVCTTILLMKKEMDNIFQHQLPHQKTIQSRSDDSVASPFIQQSEEHINKTQRMDNHSSVVEIESTDTDTSASTPNDIRISDYSEQQAKDLLSDMPDVMLNSYIDKFMANSDSDILVDKRRFAERAIEELYQPNSSEKLVGGIKLSYSASFPKDSINPQKLNSKAKLFAHLDTFGHVPQSPFVFVKWVNNSTGQVLLFEKKNILPNSKQNWVSFIPDEGWQVGSYDIRFYQFTSELEPIAQYTYDVYEIIKPD